MRLHRPFRLAAAAALGVGALTLSAPTASAYVAPDGATACIEGEVHDEAAAARGDGSSTTCGVPRTPGCGRSTSRTA